MTAEGVNMQRALGRIESQVEGLVATMVRVDRRSEKRDEVLDEVIRRVSAVEQATISFTATAGKMQDFERMLRDIKLQSRAFVLGVAFAGGLVATGLGFVVNAVWKGLT